MSHDWLRWPETCSATAIRGGDEEACGAVAVAVGVYKADWPEAEFDPHAYPVCKHHARGRDLMSLVNVIELARALRTGNA